MKLLIDTNVILDVLLAREPFVSDAVQVLELSKQNPFEEAVSASAVTDIYYIVQRATKSKEKTRNLIRHLLNIVRIESTGQNEIEEAVQLDWPDFEDAVQYAVASSAKADFIITRNPDDFSNAPITVLTPRQAIERFY